MTATTQSKPWDFSHVLDLVNSLSFHDSPSSDARFENEDNQRCPSTAWSQEAPRSNTDSKDFAPQSTSLGDFSRIFQYLGTPAASPSPVPAVQPLKPPTTQTPIFSINTGYTSDGAANAKFLTDTKRTVRWQDVSDTELQDTTEAVSDSSMVPDSPTLTKTQRKKRNRKARKAREAEIATNTQTAKGVSKHNGAVSESEAEFVLRKAPAKKASVHPGIVTPKKHYNLRERDESGRASNGATPQALYEAARLAAEKVQSAKKANNTATQQKENGISHQMIKSPKTPARQVSEPAAIPSSLPNGKASEPPNSTAATKAANAAALHFLPSTVGAKAPPPPQAFAKVVQRTNGSSHTASGEKSAIQPMVVRSGEDRHWALLMKLIHDFFEDRKHLISPMNLTTHNNNPNGIHIFVDASNIFIGFNDQLKRSRGIPTWTQIPPVDLSFDALALLMERRRPVAKRVLVGSNPWLSAFDKAKAVGYECSILEKVYKARELTERQIYFKEHDRYGNHRKQAKAPPANSVASAVNGGSGSGSGSETNTPQYAPARMIEQGVDEILHLKILESIVDAETPSTMVLATGDAARAEYSEGFMAMAERALKKGWSIELVSWSHNVSAMYSRKAWTETWGERFRVVYLDDYAEELLDM